MKILHVLASGDVGGIEVLCKDIGLYSSNQNEFCFLWHGGVIEEEMREKELKTYVIGISNNHSIQPVRAYFSLKRIITGGQYEAVIFHHSAPLMWFFLSALKGKTKNVNYYQYAHNHFDNLVSKDGKKSSIRTALLRRACEKADGVIAISNAVKESLVSNIGISKEKIKVIYNGVDTKKFIDKNIHEDNKIIFVGRVKKEKGLEYLIRAVAEVSDADFSVEIVGDGPYLDEMKRLASELGLDKKIIFLGNQRDVPELLNRAAIFIHPAIWEEGFGIAVVEAMACGLICITSNTGALPEIISDGENGFLVEKGNVEKLAGAIEKALSLQEAERNRMRNSARERAEYFSISNMVSNLDAYLYSKSDEG